MKRAPSGLTLLELVAAIALTGFVVTGSSWWIRTSTQRAAATTQTLRHESALEAVFVAIARDLVVGDLVADSAKSPRVTVKSSSLSIATRSRVPGIGAVVREYLFQSASGELTESERALDSEASHGAAPGSRVVLGDVRSFEAGIDEKTRLLTVEVVLRDGTMHQRHWMLP